jgi:FkbM family methyltransferase
MVALTAEFTRHATMDDIVAAYRIFLRRLPEPEGYSHFEREVKLGMSLERLVSIFVEADEFKRLCQPEVTVVDLGGYSVCVDAKDPDFGPGILYNRDYEPHVRAAIRERFRPGQTFVDIGANIGCISLLAASIAGPSGRVISFEPNPTNLQRLYAGIVLNGFENVEVRPLAVSDRRATFTVSGGTSNSVVREAQGLDDSVYAQSVVLDDELAHLSSIDFIKIDIEGHEPRALRGAGGLIRKHRPTLLTEFCPRCLEDGRGGLGPRDYLRQIFGFYDRVRAITMFGDSIEFDDPEAVMDHWRRRDAELAAEGEVAEGMLHFDLIAAP